MRKTVLAVLAAVSLAHSAGADTLSPAARYTATHQREILGRLVALGQFHSVAAEPEGLTDAAAALQAELAARGFAVQHWSADGSPPVVFGSLPVAGATRTVVFYAHYDGQPVTAAQWHSDAFSPVMRANGDPASAVIDWQHAATLDPEWRLFGRALADDKLSIAAFLAGFDALKASGERPGVNLKVVWEGEEEAGSPHLAAILAAHKAELAAGLWLIGDGPVHQSRTATIVFGARGVVDLDATLYGPIHPLHDGHYGNWAPNPAALTAEFISELRAPDGTIRIPYYDDDVRPLTPAERAAIAALPPIDAALRQQFVIAQSESPEGLTLSTMRPAINIRGLRAGQTGAGAAAAIPSNAEIAMDLRLVPNQTPQGVRAKLEGFLRSRGWTVVHEPPDAAMRLASPRLVYLKWGPGYPALRSSMESPQAKAVIAAARAASGGKLALLPMLGGSVPLYLFHDILGAGVIVVPIANHDDSQHASDENLRLQNLWDGVNLYAGLMSGLRW